MATAITALLHTVSKVSTLQTLQTVGLVVNPMESGTQTKCPSLHFVLDALPNIILMK